MTLYSIGLVLLVAWPLYNVVLIACSWRGTRPTLDQRRSGPDGSPDRYWLLVPCLNEERVVGRTVSGALGLTAGGARVDVLVIDDGSDDGSPAVLAAIADQTGPRGRERQKRLHVLRRELPNARRGKGAALNAAYRYIREQVAAAGDDPDRVVVGVIDGDGRGSANILDEVSAFFADTTVSAVQCRVRIHNRDRLLGAVQDLEFGCVANASQIMRDAFGTVGLGGNGQFARLSALVRLGDTPWSDCLVEDLELGLRMHLGGERIRYASRAAITQQGVVDPHRLLRQRTRWAQGNLQCARYLPKLFASRRIRNHALLEMLHYLLAPWVNAVGTLLVAALWGFGVWRLLVDHRPTVLVASPGDLGLGLGIWAAAVLLPGLVWAVLHRLQLRDEQTGRLLRAGLAYPGLLALGLASTWRAIARCISGRNGWVKTERLTEEPPCATTPRRSTSSPVPGPRPSSSPLSPPRSRQSAGSDR